MPVPPQAAPQPRVVNLCQATQTTIIAPNPMLQGALLMQQMQGNMRGFAMGGQQFRQFFSAGARSSLLGPVPMGMTMKSPLMGFPAARHFHPHARYYNNNNNSSNTPSTATDFAARQPDRKRDNEQRAGASQSAATTDTSDKIQLEGGAREAEERAEAAEELTEEPVLKKQRTEGPEEPKEQSVAETDAEILTQESVAETNEEILTQVFVAEPDTEIVNQESVAEAEEEVLTQESVSEADERVLDTDTEDAQPECIILEEGSSVAGSMAESEDVEALEEIKAAEAPSGTSAPSPSAELSSESQHVDTGPKEAPADDGAPPAPSNDQEENKEGALEDVNKLYCYLCSITCRNQQNFRSHMNGISHQQRMMEIQHMSNACLVSLLPQESLQAAHREGEKTQGLQRWCATCQIQFSCSVTDHRRTQQHKLASQTASSSCTICKRHFRTPQLFVEHMYSQEHRQGVEELQEKDCVDPLAELASISAEDEDSPVGGEDDEEQEGSHEQETEVTLEGMATDEEHDADTVYGSSFLVPVAGFLCRLCSKFYHFESSALHSHCKSLKHFENLKKYKASRNTQTDGAREPLPDSNSDEPVADCLDGSSNHAVPGSNSLSGDQDSGSSVQTMQPTVTIARLTLPREAKSKQNQLEPAGTPQEHATDAGGAELPLHSQAPEVETPSRDDGAQATPAALPSGVGVEPDSERAVAAEAAGEEKEVGVAPDRKVPAAKAKATPKRRSSRAARR